MDHANRPRVGEDARQRGPHRLLHLVPLALCLAWGALIALRQGQDATWDLRAYHYYNGWALWNDRLEIDTAAAGAHSYFNPLLDAISYAMMAWSPMLAAAAWGAWLGAGLFFLYLLAYRILQPAHGSGLFAIFVATTIAMASGLGALTVSMVGNTMNETQLIPFVTGAMLTAHLAMGKRRRIWPWGALSAFLLGAAAGLKFTAASYAVGPLAVIGMALLMRRRLVEFAAVSGGALAGFAAAYGWWGYTLERTFGSPVFPLYNDIFGSKALAPGVQGPASGGLGSEPAALVAPAMWMFGRPELSETAFQDARVFLALVASILFVGWLVLASRRGWRPLLSAQPERYVAGLSACYLASFLVWVLVFRVARYTAAMEVAGTFMLLVLACVVGARFRRGSVLPVAFVIALLAATTTYAQWGRVPFQESATGEIPELPLRKGSLILVIDGPTASNQLTYLLPELGAEHTYVEPGGTLFMPQDGSRLARQSREAVGKADALAVLSFQERDPAFRDSILGQLGVCLDDEPITFHTALSGETVLFHNARRCESETL